MAAIFNPIMIRPHRIGDSSVFLGQTCALCKEEFGVGDEIVVCPEDGSRHHVHCWQANGNKCTAYGCKGEGTIGVISSRPRPQPARAGGRQRPRVITREPGAAGVSSRSSARPIPNAPGSKVRTLPAGSIGCGQTCLLIAIVIAILLIAAGCFGLWAITGSLRGVLWYFPHREPLSCLMMLNSFRYPIG